MAKILVIDDEATVRYAVRSVLEREGHAVVEAQDGEDAIEILAREPVDVALVDIIMPNKEGMETTFQILRDYPDVRVVAISGGGRNLNFNFLRMAEKLGAHAALKKPFTDDQLIDAVRGGGGSA